MGVAPTFEGMGEKAVPFLKALGFHQSKEWFHENKALYESDVRKPLGDLVDHVSARLGHERLPLQGSRKSSLFRINRDVRFSKDKNPYKTNASAILSRDGTKKSQGFIYIHIDPEGSWIGAGFYGLMPDQLAHIRRAIVAKPSEFAEIQAGLAKHGLQISPHEGALKRNPKGFEDVTDPAIATLIRQKHFTVRQDVDADAVTSPALADQIVEFAKICLPFIVFGWEALAPSAEAA